jgi:hypothetical protein
VNGTSVEYDDRGRRTSGVDWTADYDGNDQLLWFDNAGYGTAQFENVPTGERIHRVGPDGDRWYFPGLYEERETHGARRSIFTIHGPSGPVAQEVWEGGTRSVRYLVSALTGIRLNPCASAERGRRWGAPQAGRAARFWVSG